MEAGWAWRLSLLSYRNGVLDKAVTRGMGKSARSCTNNAWYLKTCPIRLLLEEGELVRGGEAVIKYSDFKRLTRVLKIDARYKNPETQQRGSVHN